MPAPPFRFTPTSVALVTELERLVGRLEGLQLQVPEPRLRRRNRIRTVQGTVAIEGNTLSLEQVTALLEGKRVIGPTREVLEVQNALRAYELAAELPPWSERTVRRLHQELMSGLAADAGRWRSGEVGIFRGTKVRHVAPPAKLVPVLMSRLLAALRADRTTPIVIKACLAHYELQFIHPFSDGNGRAGRLWQYLILVHDSPVFRLVPVESVVRDRQKAYYRALARADSLVEATPFVEFMLGCLRDCLAELVRDFRPRPVGRAERIAHARSALDGRWFARRDYLAIFKDISTATASRDLEGAVLDGTLARRGERAVSVYRFRTS